MSTLENVLVEDRGAVRLITLNRTAKKNAFNIALAADLTHALHAANTADAVRVVVVTNAGDTFSAGVDLKMFSEMSGGGDVSMVTTIEQQLLKMQKPILAAVNGRAVGMGVTLLPFFDMVYASDTATFTTPFVKLGIVLEYGSSYLLPRLIGRQRTNELILRAAPIDAATAENWGLVTRVFPAAALVAEVLAIAGDVAGNGPHSIRKCRELISQGQNSTLQESIDREWNVLMGCYASEEFATAILNFASKPKP
jgi:enoyl-CoA hydratase/carnithine racemase